MPEIKENFFRATVQEPYMIQWNDPEFRASYGRWPTLSELQDNCLE